MTRQRTPFLPFRILPIAAPSLLLLLSACGATVPASLGEECGPTRGCEEGLTCLTGVCSTVGGGLDAGQSEVDAGSTHGGGNSDAGPFDAGADGGAENSGMDAGSCGPCDTPPTECHARTGSCVNGACEYLFVHDAPCNDKNPCTVADTCVAGSCVGTPMVCDAAPANICVSGTQLKAYDQTGSCQGGLCTYKSQTVACSAGGCSNGACQTDPCAAVTCNTPPSGCFTSAGVCQNGSCSYPYANGAGCDDGNSCTDNDSCQSGVCKGVPKACNTPPAAVCENASTLRVYSSVGSCNVGQCGYSYSFASCANGCANAQCTGSGWTVMNSNVTVDLKTVWAASPTQVWAGGELGTLVHFNGVQWQVRPSGVSQSILEIHGTAWNDIFALTALNVLHYDGTSWSTIDLPKPFTSPYSLFAVGPRQVLLYGRVSSSSSTTALIKYEQVGGTWQAVTLQSGGFRPTSSVHRMWAESPTAVYLPGGNLWDGAQVTQLATSTYLNTGPGGLFAAGGFVLALDWQNGHTPLYRYEASSNTWVPMPTGFIGGLYEIGGVSSSRIFAVGYASGGAGVGGHVLHFDGIGWTDLQLPPGVGPLRGVWPLASGEVFVVGDQGRILRGP